MTQETQNIPVQKQARYTIHAQYLRDASFENPQALESLRPGQPAPEIEVNVGMDARKAPDSNLKNFYEVVLSLRAQARRKIHDKNEDKIETLFIAELQYGAGVSLNDDLPEDLIHPLLFIEIPRFLFPFARQILCDLTINGGFPPLMINPVDFQALYLQKFSSEKEKPQT